MAAAGLRLAGWRQPRLRRAPPRPTSLPCSPACSLHRHEACCRVCLLPVHQAAGAHPPSAGPGAPPVPSVRPAPLPGLRSAIMYWRPAPLLAACLPQPGPVHAKPAMLRQPVYLCIRLRGFPGASSLPSSERVPRSDGAWRASLPAQVYVSDRNIDDELVRSISLPAQDPNAAEVFYRIITGGAGRAAAAAPRARTAAMGQRGALLALLPPSRLRSCVPACVSGPDGRLPAASSCCCAHAHIGRRPHACPWCVQLGGRP